MKGKGLAIARSLFISVKVGTGFERVNKSTQRRPSDSLRKS